MNVTNIHSKCVMNITDEYSLQCQVVKYLRETDLVFCATLGGFLHTVEDRLKAVKSGYNAGVPDIMISTPCSGYKGMCIELKSPTGFGQLEAKQLQWLNNLSIECDYFCICSNDYTEILECIIKYVHGLL